MNEQRLDAGSSRAPLRARTLLFEPDARVWTRQEIVEMIFKHLRFAIGVFTTVVLLSVAVIYLTPQVYEAKAKVLIERGKSPTQRSDIAAYQLEAFEVIMSEIEILKSRTVAEEVVDELGLATRPRRDNFMRRLSDGITNTLTSVGLLPALDRREKMIRMIQRILLVEPAPQSSVLLITFRSESPEDAAAITRSATEAFLRHHRKVYGSDNVEGFFLERVSEIEEQLRDLRERQRRQTSSEEAKTLSLEIGVLETSYVFFREKLNAAQAEQVADTSLVNLRVIDHATVPQRPVRPRILYVALAIVAAILLAVALSLVREYFDQDIYSVSDVEKHFGLPVLGTVALAPSGIADEDLSIS